MNNINNQTEKIKMFIKEHGWGPLGSVIFHMLMVLILINFAVNASEDRSASVEVVMMETKADQIEPVEPIHEDTPMNNITEIPTDVTTPMDALITSESFEMPGDPSVADGVGGGTANFGIGGGSASDGIGFEMAFTKSPLVMKGLYSNRRAGGKGGGRAGAIKKYGGSNAGETAVLKALRWLKEHQNEDGSWSGAGSQTAMCGLALLCYMAHGETPASKEFGTTVEKAIRYLMYAQDASGKFKDAGANYSYGHAIATYALAESYGMTKMVLLKEPLEKAVQLIIDGQQVGGAWNYNYEKGTRRDMSVTGWQVQALKAAKLAGAENKGLQECLYKAVDGVKSFAGTGGGYGYDNAGNSPTLAGTGMLCLQFLDRAEDPTVVATFKATETVTPSWPNGASGIYNWYYMTQARYQKGGPLWDSWNRAMLPMLVKNQQADGHWLAGSTHGSCDVYDTTLCCLTLEVYYRYLPTYDRADEVKAKPKTKDEADAKIAAQITL